MKYNVNIDKENLCDFTERLKRGEAFIRKISEIDDSVDIELPTEYKLLFSMLEDLSEKANINKIEEGKISFDTVHIGVLGIKIGGKLYPFNVEYKKKVHATLIIELIKNSSSYTDIHDALLSVNTEWQNYYASLFASDYYNKFNEEYDKKIAIIKQDVFSKFEGNSIHKYRNKILLEKYPELPNDKINSLKLRIAEYYSKCAEINKNCHTEVKKVKNRFALQGVKEKSKAEQNEVDKLNNKAKEDIDSYTKQFESKINRDYSISFSVSDIQKIVNSRYYTEREHYIVTHGFMTVEELEEYKLFSEHIKTLRNRICEASVVAQKVTIVAKKFDKIFSEIKLIFKNNIDTELTESKVLSANAVKKAREDIYSFLQEYQIDSNDDLYTELRELEKRYYRHLAILAPKYVEGKSRWGLPTPIEKMCLKEKITGMEQEREAYLTKKVQRCLQQEFKYIYETVLRLLNKNHQDICDVFVLPTGMVLQHVNGKYTIDIISPLSKEIISALNEKQRERWKETWQKYIENELDACDNFIRHEINEDIAETTIKHENSLNCWEQRLFQFKKEYQFNIDTIINEKSGGINQPWNSEDVVLLEQTIPYIGGFIDKIELLENLLFPSLQNIKKQVTDYLAGISIRSNCLFYYSGCGLVFNLCAFKQLFHIVDGDINKATGMLLSCIAVVIYENLSKSKRETFEQMIGEKAVVSKMAFYKTYGRKVESIAERRRLVCRTLFIIKFKKYAKNELETEMADYFNSLKQ